MAKSLLTGPLSDDLGARMAVFAARDVLQKWTETRVDQAVQSIDIAVEDWKHKNDVTGLQAVIIDTIDVLCALEWSHETVPALEGLSLDKRVALAILNEAGERPHVATKGGAVLAAYTIGMIEVFGRMYDSEWLPNIQRGAKVHRSAAEGHMMVHGTREEKTQRWTGQCVAYDHFFKATGKKNLAKKDAAVECGVSVKTIERSLKRQREGTL